MVYLVTPISSTYFWP